MVTPSEIGFGAERRLPDDPSDKKQGQRKSTLAAHNGFDGVANGTRGVQVVARGICAAAGCLVPKSKVQWSSYLIAGKSVAHGQLSGCGLV